jgi:hypothetical protein
MKEKIQAWNDKYNAVKGTPEYSKYLAEYQAKINGRWKYIGHGVPSPGREYTVKKYGGKVYLVTTKSDGEYRYVIKDGDTDYTKFI